MSFRGRGRGGNSFGSGGGYNDRSNSFDQQQQGLGGGAAGSTSSNNGVTDTLHVLISQVQYPVSEEMMQRVFDGVAPVRRIHVLPVTNPSEATAIVQFTSPEAATEALGARNGRMIYTGSNKMTMNFTLWESFVQPQAILSLPTPQSQQQQLGYVQGPYQGAGGVQPQQMVVNPPQMHQIQAQQQPQMYVVTSPQQPQATMMLAAPQQQQQQPNQGMIFQGSPQQQVQLQQGMGSQPLKIGGYPQMMMMSPMGDGNAFNPMGGGRGMGAPPGMMMGGGGRGGRGGGRGGQMGGPMMPPGMMGMMPGMMGGMPPGMMGMMGMPGFNPMMGGGNMMMGGGGNNINNQQQQQQGDQNQPTVFLSVAFLASDVPLQDLFVLLEAYGGVVSIRRNQKKPEIVAVKMASIADADACVQYLRNVPLGSKTVNAKRFPTYMDRYPCADDTDPTDPAVLNHDFTTSLHRSPHQRSKSMPSALLKVTQCPHTEAELMTFFTEYNMYPENITKDGEYFLIRMNNVEQAVQLLIKCQNRVCGEVKSNVIFIEDPQGTPRTPYNNHQQQQQQQQQQMLMMPAPPGGSVVEQAEA